MAVEKVINPVDNTEVVLVSGTVKKITFFEAKNNQFATHTASILVDDVYVKMNITVKEGFNPRVQYPVGKKPDVKYHTLEEGDNVRIQVMVSEWNGKEQYKTTMSRIVVTGKTTASAGDNPSQAKGQTAVPATADKKTGTKIYGVIKSKDSNGMAVVSDNNTGAEHNVNLSNNPEAEVGHSIGAFISGTGEILNNYKHYPPKQSNGKKADAFGSPERQFKMAFGNMVNVAAIALQGGDPADVFSLAQDLFKPAAELREKLLKEFEGVRDESDVGGKLGDALKHGAEAAGHDIEGIIIQAEKWFRMHEAAENGMKKRLEQKEAVEDSPVNTVDDFDDTPSDEDYDDPDIPF